MKVAAATMVLTLFAAQAVAMKLSFRQSATPAEASAPSPAAAPGPAGPGLPVVDVEFEIVNYNYNDLGRCLEEEESNPDMKWGPRNQHHHTPAQMSDNVAQEQQGPGLLELGVGHPSPMEHCRPSRDRAPSCVRDLLEDSVVHVVEDLVQKHLLVPAGAPAPAPAVAAPAPAMFLEAGNASSPAAAPVASPAASPAATLPKPVEVHVTFQPGSVRKLSLLGGGNGEDGRSIVAEVTVVAHTGDGVNEFAEVKTLMDTGAKDGTLAEAVAGGLFEATGLKAVVNNMKVGAHEMRQWSIDVCVPHLKDVVKKFSVAYTRRMVPMAIYNECTNFMAQVSFSNNPHVTHVDTERCQAATVQFASSWQSGAKKDFDYKAFCHNICELKYGVDMPKCHITSGDKILNLGH